MNGDRQAQLAIEKDLQTLITAMNAQEKVVEGAINTSKEQRDALVAQVK